MAYQKSDRLPEFFLSEDKKSPWFEERKLFLMQLRILCKVDRVQIEHVMGHDFFRMPPDVFDELRAGFELILADRTNWYAWAKRRQDEKRLFNEPPAPDRKSEAAR